MSRIQLFVSVHPGFILFFYLIIFFLFNYLPSGSVDMVRFHDRSDLSRTAASNSHPYNIALCALALFEDMGRTNLLYLKSY